MPALMAHFLGSFSQQSPYPLFTHPRHCTRNFQSSVSPLPVPALLHTPSFRELPRTAPSTVPPPASRESPVPPLHSSALSPLPRSVSLTWGTGCFASFPRWGCAGRTVHSSICSLSLHQSTDIFATPAVGLAARPCAG